MVKPTRRPPRSTPTPPPAPRDRHYYVPDQHGGYCAACGLPAANRRHAPKAA